MTKITLPSFSGYHFSANEMRQLVSAVELRLQSIEGTTQTFRTTTESLDARFAPLVHAHSESDIVDLQSYLLDISTQSLLTLKDVVGTPRKDYILKWNATNSQFVLSPSVQFLTNLTDVNTKTPKDKNALVYNATLKTWEAQSFTAQSALSSLSDVDLSSTKQYDLLFNATGTRWDSTGGELSWNPALQVLELANNRSIHWLDVSTISLPMLNLDSAGTPVESLLTSLFYADRTVPNAAFVRSNPVDLEFGAGTTSTGRHFTVETWILWDADLSGGIGGDWNGEPNNSWKIEYVTGGTINITTTSNGIASGEDLQTFSFLPTLNVWHHFAWSNNPTGDESGLWMDGVQVGTFSSAAFIWAGSGIHWGTVSGAAHHGNLQETRITTQMARYEQNFPVPTKAFGRNTDSDVHFNHVDFLCNWNGNPSGSDANVAKDESNAASPITSGAVTTPPTLVSTPAPKFTQSGPKVFSTFMVGDASENTTINGTKIDLTGTTVRLNKTSSANGFEIDSLGHFSAIGRNVIKSDFSVPSFEFPTANIEFTDFTDALMGRIGFYKTDDFLIENRNKLPNAGMKLGITEFTTGFFLNLFSYTQGSGLVLNGGLQSPLIKINEAQASVVQPILFVDAVGVAPPFTTSALPSAGLSYEDRNQLSTLFTIGFYATNIFHIKNFMEGGTTELRGINAAATERVLISANADSGIGLLHNGATKLATATGGVNVTGNLVATANMDALSATTKNAVGTVVTNAVALDYAVAENWFVDLEPASAAVTITLTGGPAANRGIMTVRVQQATASAWTIVWAGGTFLWVGGAAPVMTATADAVDVFRFETTDGGTTWLGKADQNYA